MKPTLKAKLTLRAQELNLTTDNRDDYYLTVKLQKHLTLADIAREVAALGTRQEDADEVERTLRQGMERIVWFLSAGYSVGTPVGNFRPSVNGVLTGSELASSPDRDRLRLGVTYTMSRSMRQAMTDAELDIKILRAPKGPQLYQVLNIQDARNPEALTRGEGRGIRAGEVCLIRGKKIKVGGTDSSVGITLTRTDVPAGTESYFFSPDRLYPNTISRVGFVMPASATAGSEWSVTLRTQLINSNKAIQSVYSVTTTDLVVVG